MRIIYEDEWILLVDKPAGLAVETKRIDEEDVESLLRKRLKDTEKGKAKPYLACINRLDQPVRGLVLFARTPAAAADLSAQLNRHEIAKIYEACVYGSFEAKEGTLKDVLLKDGRTNTSRVLAKNDPEYGKGKEAVLTYEEVSPGVLKIRLQTGRHHQIRVQLSHAGHPILGDTRYGSEASLRESREKGIKRLMLTACELGFVHPKTKKSMHFTIEDNERKE